MANRKDDANGCRTDKEENVDYIPICIICGNRSYSNDEAVKHYADKHDVQKKLPCPVCSKKISYASVRAKHVRSCHPGYEYEAQTNTVKRIQDGSKPPEKEKQTYEISDSSDDEENGRTILETAIQYHEEKMLFHQKKLKSLRKQILAQ